MGLHHNYEPDPEHAELLRRLVREEGLKRFAFFDVVGEGHRMPNGLEVESGHVVDASGRVFSFWTGWDTERGAPKFHRWDEVRPESDWLEDEEYREALDSVGLAP